MTRHLIGERDDAGEQRRRQAGPALWPPPAVRAAEILGDRALARGVHRDVGDRAHAAGADAVLVTRPCEDGREPAAAAGPADVAPLPAAAAGQEQPGAADGGHQRIAGWPADDVSAVQAPGAVGEARRALVPGRGQHRHPVAGPCRQPERRPEAQQLRLRGEGLLGCAETHADHAAEVVPEHVRLGGHDLCEAGRALDLRGRRLDQHDAGSGRDHVRPLDVQGRLHRAGFALLAARPRRDRAGRGDHPERRRGRQPEGRIEVPQVLPGQRRPERVHDHDRLAPAVDAARVQRPHVVCGADLGGGEQTAGNARPGRGGPPAGIGDRAARRRPAGPGQAGPGQAGLGPAGGRPAVRGGTAAAGQHEAGRERRGDGSRLRGGRHGSSTVTTGCHHCRLPADLEGPARRPYADRAGRCPASGFATSPFLPWAGAP